jgi:hypothetical protein
MTLSSRALGRALWIGLVLLIAGRLLDLRISDAPESASSYAGLARPINQTVRWSASLRRTLR